MQRATVPAIIKDHEVELKQLGVVSLSLFGSTARDQAGAYSDVDAAVRLEEIQSGLALFNRLNRVQERLRTLLGTDVDVVPEPRRHNGIKAAIERDRVLAF